MPCEAVFQRVEVEVSVAFGLVGCVHAKSEVYPQHQELKVVTQSESGVQRKLFGKLVNPELSSGAFRVFLDDMDR